MLELVDRMVKREPIHPFDMEPDEVETVDLLYYMKFEPGFDKVLKRLKPKRPSVV